ncbi:tyrosine-type recombinase/integrase, partial [Microvirga zambiensis]|uniref:tyrosine-type recombinase/integrase n=1 Tax=Microvirga zambiensis TaxID=1402137 RepID=UPI0019200873
TRTVVCELLLRNRSPRLADLTDEALARLRADAGFTAWAGGTLHGIHRALAALGYASPPGLPTRGWRMPVEGAPAVWMEAVDHWYGTSTLTPAVRREYRSILSKVGRWMTQEQPGVAAPGDWTRATCAAYVARVDRMLIGDFAQRRSSIEARAGLPLAPTSKASYISVVRGFFREGHEHGWCPPRFDPSIALVTPRAVKALIFPKPRIIADDAWAKLVWAGLNLTADDLAARGIIAYPLALVRALALTWLFIGQRSDEIVRLRVGCIRWQADSADPSAPPVCLLDVPVHKTGPAFTKPVDPLVGRAVEAWEAARPAQAPLPDRKTGEPINILFAVRGRAVANTYINKSIIPLLCAKGGVPDRDVRGRITSHRARATIASQLYNAKEPMTLFELQAWLGHTSPETTRHYAAITPNTLTKAYGDAGYFARNVRTIEVLIDREAVLSGAAAAGAPWQHYDLGHGWCSYSFFEQCPHRMACAKCDFYIPKPSAKAQLLEAREGMDHRLAVIPLTDDERAAVEGDREAVAALVARLADTPTPAGPTPRDIAARPRTLG